MPLLELRGVSARYGPLTALHDVSLSVDDGEVVSLLGANGAGKTTTLRSISGTVKRGGTLLFDGKALPRTAEAVARRGITHVPEGRGILADLTVWENLRMGAYLRRDRKGVQRDLEEQCQRLPWLWDRRGQQAGTLSGGEQQMLALARALVARPRMVLLDEPSLGLAPMVVQAFFDLVRRLNREDGVTFLVVEQNATVALDVSNRTYVLEVGHIALSGASAELAKDEGIRSSYLGY
jgi:branched-chain amino acid transport system ATP-binding protein